MSREIEPFAVNIPQDAIDDLKARLARTRLPEAETSEGWEQGVPIAQLERLLAHWRDEYDWRRFEAELNSWPQYRTTIDGLGIHFLHVRSPEPDARPLIMTHGWPGSVAEFMKVIGPLTDPVAHGGEARDAFHLVMPSLPGYGFSDRPSKEGWTLDKVAEAWAELMQRLGYDHYLVQGGDWGSGVTMILGGADYREHVDAIHVNLCYAYPGPEDQATLTDEERDIQAKAQRHAEVGRGYSIIQSTRPQTLGYSLADSPSGQAAWIYEKYKEWSDCGDDPVSVFTLDEMLDNITLYWLTNTGLSSGRMYWQNRQRARTFDVTAPLGMSVFPKELFRATRRFAERDYPTLSYFNTLDKGGHFAAFEVPELFVDEVRACFRDIGR